MKRLWGKGRDAVLGISLAEMAFLLVFALAIVASSSEINAQRVEELERQLQEEMQLNRELEAQIPKGRSDIPPPCEGYWLDVVVVSAVEYCVNGSQLSAAQLRREFGDQQRAIEAEGDCKLRIRVFASPGLDAEAFQGGLNALSQQFYYRQSSGTRSCR